MPRLSTRPCSAELLISACDDASPIGDNLLRPFQLERSALRGRLVRLGALVDRVLTRHDYPAPVSRLLGELFVLAATLAGGLKFKGTFSLQVRSAGPVSLMIADCTNDGRCAAMPSSMPPAVAAAPWRPPRPARRGPVSR